MFPRIFKLFTLLNLLVLVQAAPTSSTVKPTPTTTGCGSAATTGFSIRAVTPNTPVANFELADVGTKPVLKPFGWHGIWSFSTGSIAMYDWTSSCFAVKYLNIEDSANSYKPLTWSFANLTSTWKVSSQSDIGTAPTCTTTGNTDFLACQQSEGWTLYLQTGNDVPAGVTCTTTKLRYFTS